MSDFDLSSINSVSDVFPRPKRKAVRKGKKVKRVPVKNPMPWGYKIGEREICDETPAGRAEYRRRTLEMAEWQNWVCGCGCGQVMSEISGYPESATFEHEDGRGAGHRDDRTKDKFGRRINKAFRLWCNSEKGSKRI